jgi:hypothetical protein
MWWRALGVAVVLLCAGAAGGYAVAQRGADAPLTSDRLTPVPGVSPAVPTPVTPTYEPDPEQVAPLTTDGLDTVTTPLRLTPEGPGVKVAIPGGWSANRPADKDFWTFTEPSDFHYTYALRVALWNRQTLSKKAAMESRIAALTDASANGGISDFEVTQQTDDTFQATYIDGGHLRFTTERFISFGTSTEAYVSVAVTGREEDRTGMGNLLAQTVTSLRELKAKPAAPGDAG